MPASTVLRALRLAFGALAATAIVVQFFSGSSGSAFKAVNFLSFFTIQGNLLGIVVLVLGALRPVTSPGRDLLRGAAAFALVLIGLVFAILLADIQEDLQLTKPWVNTVLHQLMPVVLAVDWLVDPPDHRLRFRQALVWLAFPAVWVVYTLIRGPLADWYPYPFIDPAVHGAAGVAGNCAAILAGMVLMVAVVVAVGNALRTASHGRA